MVFSWPDPQTQHAAYGFHSHHRQTCQSLLELCDDAVAACEVSRGRTGEAARGGGGRQQGQDDQQRQWQ